jgi:hypothetical protein
VLQRANNDRIAFVALRCNKNLGQGWQFKRLEIQITAKIPGYRLPSPKLTLVRYRSEVWPQTR